MEKNKHTFYHYINSACLAVGVMGLLIHFEVSPLQFGLAGLLLWSVTGILGMEAEKKAKELLQSGDSNASEWEDEESRQKIYENKLRRSFVRQAVGKFQ